MLNISEQELNKRFFRRVVKTESGCWNWIGAHNKQGYGRFRFETRYVLPHRFLYELTVGAIPTGYLLCHKCDNHRCANPDHMFIGTHLDNQIDAMNKGRWTSDGLLSNEIVEAIKTKSSGQWGEQTRLAEEYGIGKWTVNRIIRGISYQCMEQGAGG